MSGSRGSGTSCFAASSAVECERAASHRVETSAGDWLVCERHLRLLEVKLEREGLDPRAMAIDARTAAGPGGEGAAWLVPSGSRGRAA